MHVGKESETGSKDRRDCHNDPHTRLLTYREYRIMLAAAVFHHECDYFPMSKYKEAFLSFDDCADQGYIAMNHLGKLLEQTGHPQEEEKVAEIVAELDRSDGLLLFDDFADVMKRFVDVRAEQEVLEKLVDKGRLLRIELIACAIRLLKIPFFILLFELYSLFNMLIDVYLMAQSFYTNSDKHKERVASYLMAMGKVFDALRPLPL